MFNSYSSSYSASQNIKINAVSGAILKNHPKSWFERFNLKSPRADSLLKEGGHVGTSRKQSEYSNYSYTVTDKDKNIIVLQMMICGDMEVLAECVYEKDYYVVTEEKMGGTHDTD